MQTKHLDADFEIKDVSEAGTFEGFASRFGELDSDADKVAAGAFKASLRDHKRKNRMPALLWQHDTREPIGAWRDMRETDEGLVAKGELFVDDIPRAKQAHKLMKEGALSGLSIGFHTVESEIDSKKGIRTLTKVDLFEVSLVTFPALDTARITSVKAALEAGDMPTEREVEAFLRESGFSRKQACHMAAEWKSVTQRESGDGMNDVVAALRETAAAMRANA